MTFVGPKEVCANACRRLEECLLTQEEFELGPRLWHAFVDPLRDVCTRGKVDPRAMGLSCRRERTGFGRVAVEYVASGDGKTG
jgi:hypothetical protein